MAPVSEEQSEGIRDAMTSFDPKLGVQVMGDEIIVTLLGTSYSVTYYKGKARACWGMPVTARWNLKHRRPVRLMPSLKGARQLDRKHGARRS